jgi:Domain of unknown function (DUF397)
MQTLDFRKSTYSNPSQNCVEIAWRTSSYSGGDNGTNCVEIGWESATQTCVRDSKNPAAGMLNISADQFDQFLRQFV